MSVCSYLVHPVAGQKEHVARQLSGVPGCEVYPAEEHDLLILVTDAANEVEEQGVQRGISAIAEIQCLALTFGQLTTTEEESDDGKP